MSTDRISEYLAQFAQTRTQMLEQLRRTIVGQAVTPKKSGLLKETGPWSGGALSPGR